MEVAVGIPVKQLKSQKVRDHKASSSVSSERAEARAQFSSIQGDTMNFLNQLLRGIAFIPSLVNGIEELFACKSGAEKKDAAMSFLESALATVDAVAAREIVDPVKFRNGISKIIDGTVECLNALTWAGERAQQPVVSQQP